MRELELPEPIDFEWDEYNQTKIRLKHSITPEEAEQVFFKDSVLNYDKQHSFVEQRYQLVGISDSTRVLFIVFTIRNNKIRIISARSASKKERLLYADQT